MYAHGMPMMTGAVPPPGYGGMGMMPMMGSGGMGLAASSSAAPGLIGGEESRKRIRFAVVCASNMNRSMAAHAALHAKGFDVRSYGTSTTVKLPGPSIDKPNIYNFGTPYKWIISDLNRRDPALYQSNGVLKMLGRNAAVKQAPERWQNERHMMFDVVIAFEDRVFDALVDHFMKRESESFQMTHIINFPVKDTHEDAAIAAQLVVRLCNMIELCGEEWESKLVYVLEEFQRINKRIVYMPTFY